MTAYVKRQLVLETLLWKVDLLLLN